MPNPAYLVCDSDALFQLFIADELRPLRELKMAYKVQPVMVPEVEIELRSSRKFGRRFDGAIKKAIGTGTIQVFDPATLMAQLTSSGMLAASAHGTWSAIQSLGSEYQRRVGLGEAYTFAAGVVLQVPALSNDNSAINVLLGAGLRIPTPVLRVFDLLVFGHQIGILTDKMCDRFRAGLSKERESLPAEFKTASFIEGVNRFRARLCDGAAPPVGMACPDQPLHATRLTIERHS